MGSVNPLEFYANYWICVCIFLGRESIAFKIFSKWSFTWKLEGSKREKQGSRDPPKIPSLVGSEVPLDCGILQGRQDPIYPIFPRPSTHTDAEWTGTKGEKRNSGASRLVEASSGRLSLPQGLPPVTTWYQVRRVRCWASQRGLKPTPSWGCARYRLGIRLQVYTENKLGEKSQFAAETRMQGSDTPLAWVSFGCKLPAKLEKKSDYTWAGKLWYMQGFYPAGTSWKLSLGVVEG